MPDAVAEARQAIEDQLRELERQTERLRGALAQLDADSRTPSRRRPAPARRASRPGRDGRPRKRAPRGLREQQVLAVVEKNPGAKAPEIAAEIGVSSNQVYALANRLHESGKIRKRRGGGYTLKR